MWPIDAGDVFETLVRQKNIDPEAEAVHHISAAMTRDAPRQAQVGREVRQAGVLRIFWGSAQGLSIFSSLPLSHSQGLGVTVSVSAFVSVSITCTPAPVSLTCLALNPSPSFLLHLVSTAQPTA